MDRLARVLALIASGRFGRLQGTQLRDASLRGDLGIMEASALRALEHFFFGRQFPCFLGYLSLMSTVPFAAYGVQAVPVGARGAGADSSFSLPFQWRLCSDRRGRWVGALLDRWADAAGEA
jgi:hypothetical protein